ncbi:universal stress protein [Altibacter sp.]|uniref:universal stress protein n=1 Tax=Altibacter sp. TaxID=2024823 RepID=UPI000C909E03|nr:universal stress protein [Altibacter sp.]MAP55101.1 universal stress protein [Altibacter sp.]
MRKVLISTDFSENAMNAIRYALELFKYERSEFIIFHAYADEVYENTLEMSRELFEAFREKVQERSDRELQAILKEMLSISPNPRHEYNFRSVFGSLVDVSNDLVDSENADVLVMGTKGATDQREITFGSNTLQVIKYVKCPVLAIPSRFHDVHPKHILYTTDYMLPCQRRELKLVSTIAKKFVATVHFLYISPFSSLSFRQQDNKFLLSCFLSDNKTQFHQQEGKDIPSRIHTFIKDHKIDMLVMTNSRHSYLEHVLHTSKVEEIGLQIQIPFLVLQNLPRN